jgi:DNA repair exonuclease SbcCD ATPase subunit
MNYLKSQIGGLNLVVFDEVFDSLDKAGIDSVINVLSDLKQSVGNIIIVSHNDDMKFNDNIDNQLLVKKVDNTSKLVNN